MTGTIMSGPFIVDADTLKVSPAPPPVAQQLTIKNIMPAPPNWLVFYYASEGSQVSPWRWSPLMFVAHAIHDNGVEAIVPMIEGGWGLVLPAANVEITLVHVALAGEWLDEDTDLVNADGLAEYLEKVQP